MEQAQKWSGKWSKNSIGAEPGLHWSTYKAHCRRNGEWKINMNEALAAPILTAVSTNWEKVFVRILSEQLGMLMLDVEKEFREMQDMLLPQLVSAGLDESRLTMIRGPIDQALKTRAEAAVDAAKEAVQNKQRELSRSIAPEIKNAMEPGYSEAFAEYGTGSHGRRVAILENHLEGASSQMFQAAVKPVKNALEPLRCELRDVVSTVAIASTLEDVKTNYSILWQKTTESAISARKRMQPNLVLAIGEAKTALRRLLLAQGASHQEAAAAVQDKDDESGDDEEIEMHDVTDEVQRKAKEALRENAVDLTAGDDADVGPTAEVTRTSPVTVKKEKE